MCAKWKTDKDGYDRQLIANSLEDIKSRGKNGDVSFDAGRFESYVNVLSSAIDCIEELNGLEKVGLIRTAVFTAGASGLLSPDSIIREFSKCEHRYRQKPLQSYILASSLSVFHFNRLTKITIDNSTIYFSRQLPQSFQQARAHT